MTKFHLKSVRYVLYLIIVSLLTSEFVLRAIDPIGAAYFFEIHRYFKSLQQDDRFAYIHLAGLRDTYQEVEVRINRYGLRGPEFAERKTPGVKRVLILGDSVVFGWGVAYEDTFAARLQATLRHEGVAAEVIPAAVCSWNTRTELEYLKAQALTYEPDIIILVIVDNDTEVKRAGRTDVPRNELTPPKPPKSFWQNAREDVQRFVLRNSYLAVYAQFAWKKIHRSESDGVDKPHDDLSWRDAQLALDDIVRLCRERNIELLAYIYRSEAIKEPGDPLRRYEERLRALGVPTFALPHELFAGGLAYRNSVIDAHLNPAGQALVAERMRRDLARWLPTVP
jgi:lysophospholipase L1-like esterase